MIDYSCPTCREQLSSPDSLVGKHDRCPSCGRQVMVPNLQRTPTETILSTGSTTAADKSGDAPTSNTVSREMRKPVLIAIRSVALLAFAAAILSFFLIWSGSRTHRSEIMPGDSHYGYFVITMPPQTGKDAGHPGWHYGYITLVLAIVGCISSVLCLCKTRFPIWPSIMVGILGLVNLTLILRSDDKVTAFGSVSDALKQGDIALGYAAGPGAAIIGFLVAVGAGFVDVYLRYRHERRIVPD